MQLLNSQSLHLTPNLIVHPNPNLLFRYRFKAICLNRADSYQVFSHHYKDFLATITKEKKVSDANPQLLQVSSSLQIKRLNYSFIFSCFFFDCRTPNESRNLLQKNQSGEIDVKRCLSWALAFSATQFPVLSPIQSARADPAVPVYDVASVFELSIQLSYLLLLLALIGVGTFFVIRQVLTRRELDLSAKELQEQVRSGDASATEYFELGAVMLRRKIYSAATKYFLQAIDKWDGDDQDLSQVYNALGVSYVRNEKLEKAVAQFEAAVKIQPGYVTAWNNLGDAYEKKKEYTSALKAFEEALLFDPNNSVARPRRDALRERVDMYKGVPVKPSTKK